MTGQVCALKIDNVSGNLDARVSSAWYLFTIGPKIMLGRAHAEYACTSSLARSEFALASPWNPWTSLQMSLFDLIRRLTARSSDQQLHKRNAGNLYERLEDRVLFDAVVDGAADMPEADADPFAPAVESFSNQLFDNVATAAAEQSPAQNRNEIVFVDKSVEGFEILVADLVISNKAEVVFINGASDGLSQIADRLAQRSEIDAIHIISHGDDAQLSLGNSIISADNLVSNYSDQLARIGAALTDDGDILIYGCNLT